MRLIALYRTPARAEAAVADLRTAGIGDDRVVLGDRAMQAAPPPERKDPSLGQSINEWLRSAVGLRPTARYPDDLRSRLLMSAAIALVGAGIGILLGAFVGGSVFAVVIGAVVGFVAGPIAEAVWRGIFRAEQEASREEGVLVEVELTDGIEVARVAEILRRHGPVRIERKDGGRGGSTT